MLFEPPTAAIVASYWRINSFPPHERAVLIAGLVLHSEDQAVQAEARRHAEREADLIARGKRPAHQKTVYPHLAAGVSILRARNLLGGG